MSDENKKKKKAVDELTYWQKRFLKINLDVERLNKEYKKAAGIRYKKLQKELKKEIDYWLERYAKEDGITAAEANQLLTAEERKKWAMSLEEFKRKAQEGGYTSKLNKEHFRSRISRLEQLQNQIKLELAEFANEESNKLENHLVDVFDETYMRNIYELSDRGALSIDFARYNKDALKYIISKPWLGSTFSKRVWFDTTKRLPNALQQVMSNAIALGWGTDKIVKEMMAKVDAKETVNARQRMITLVQTESSHIMEIAAQKSYKETGVEKWEWLATLESHTCGDCGDLDGTPFDLDDKNAPTIPLHPNCRCTSIPVVPGFKSKYRWQRDPITGKGSIGKNMSFNEWKESLNSTR